jgi:hypothetical protein
MRELWGKQTRQSRKLYSSAEERIMETIFNIKRFRQRNYDKMRKQDEKT